MIVFEVDETSRRLGEQIPAGMLITSFNGSQGLLKKGEQGLWNKRQGPPCGVRRAVVVLSTTLVQTCLNVSQSLKGTVLERGSLIWPVPHVPALDWPRRICFEDLSAALTDADVQTVMLEGGARRPLSGLLYDHPSTPGKRSLIDEFVANDEPWIVDYRSSKRCDEPAKTMGRLDLVPRLIVIPNARLLICQGLRSVHLRAKRADRSEIIGCC
jgi:hypothetical protein